MRTSAKTTVAITEDSERRLAAVRFLGTFPEIPPRQEIRGMGLLKEFREFAMKGNVIDLAVGVVIGTA
ncbi:MAG: MscL family protein, partial [Planctomycetia bacterium]